MSTVRSFSLLAQAKKECRKFVPEPHKMLLHIEFKPEKQCSAILEQRWRPFHPKSQFDLDHATTDILYLSKTTPPITTSDLYPESDTLLPVLQNHKCPVQLVQRSGSADLTQLTGHQGSSTTHVQGSRARAYKQASQLTRSR